MSEPAYIAIRKRNNRALSTILAAFILCLAQAALMIAGATTLLLYTPAAKFIRQHLSFLQDYVPMFARYGAIFAARGRSDDFLPFVSVYLFYVLLQGITFIGLLTCFVIFYTKNKNVPREKLGFKRTLILLMLVAFFFFPLADFFFGLSDIKNPGLYDNKLLYGDYFSSVYIYCLMLPMFSLFLFLLMIVPFLGADVDLTRRAPIEPIGNSDKVWKIDSSGKGIK